MICKTLNKFNNNENFNNLKFIFRSFHVKLMNFCLVSAKFKISS